MHRNIPKLTFRNVKNNPHKLHILKTPQNKNKKHTQDTCNAVDITEE